MSAACSNQSQTNAHCQGVLIRLLVIWCSIAILESHESVGNPLEFSIDGFGTVRMKQAATITTPKSGLAAVNIDNNIFEGVLAEYPGSWVLVLDDQKKFSGIVSRDGRNYEISFERHFPNEQFRVAGYGNYSRRPEVTINEIDEEKFYTDPLGQCERHLPVVFAPEPRNEVVVVGLKSNMYCRLRMVADHTFFRRIGQGSLERTDIEIGWLLKALNPIFMNTAFHDDARKFRRIGFKIGNTTVYQRPHNDPSHFNSASLNMSIDRMLISFSTNESEENSDACGAVLLTARDFSPCSELGLSFVGSVQTEAGVCARPRLTPSGTRITPNAVVVTAVYHGELISRIELIRALAHELGHLWGAEHDRDVHAKKYIMSDSTANLRRVQTFSKASIEQMSTFLKFRQSCFEKLGSCGDGKVDSDEFCDEGVRGGPCCTEHCRLRSEAQCSQKNYGCCEECKFARAGKLCRAPNHSECLRAASCSGQSEHCPVAKPAQDGSECRNRGRCLTGVCQDYCKSIGLESCRCNGLNACRICCWRHARCEPVKLSLEDGTKCGKGGVCVRGKCQDYCAAKHMEDCFCPGVDACKRCCLHDGICGPAHGSNGLPEGSPCSVHLSKSMVTLDRLTTAERYGLRNKPSYRISVQDSMIDSANSW
ncbi:disintegrin and metalloproteinase domain-containing protein 17-like [Varroa jacobsoni]|uniref:disintegrin and metalloproteinase domain-containing protein 17-like n=1 Tax=Varroa jacobsoni TaxID=62625 RepID=UPI000BF8C6D2|nr:disintegrin and metalloproteinase domain-containing protein 17-like [Varroa jacobsoni]